MQIFLKQEWPGIDDLERKQTLVIDCRGKILNKKKLKTLEKCVKF